MNKLLYTSLVVLITVWSIFFITRFQDTRLVTENPANPVAVISQEQSQIQAINNVSPSVVGIANIQGSRVAGEGSGVVYNVEDGNTYIVTNEHVIADAESIEVVFNNGNVLEAEVVGADIFTDLAVIRLRDFESRRVARFGNTEDLAIGQSVIAIGNPLGLTFAGSATMGIVSGHDRTVPVRITQDGTERPWEMTVLQTDAAINPGNSGGALVNLAGEVIGINSMKVSARDVYGMSFSIPTYVVKPVIADIEAYGRVLRPTLGITIQAIDHLSTSGRSELGIPSHIKTGVRVNQVLDGTMAMAMGIQTGDIITHIGSRAIESVMNFTQTLFTYREGDELSVTIVRNGNEFQLQTTVIILN